MFVSLLYHIIMQYIYTYILFAYIHVYFICVESKAAGLADKSPGVDQSGPVSGHYVKNHL